MRDELGPVVHAQVTRCASLAGQLVQPVDDVVSNNGASDVDGEELPGKLVDDVEQFHGAQVARLVELEVHGPDDVRSDGAHRADHHTDAGHSLLLLLLLLLAIGRVMRIFCV